MVKTFKYILKRVLIGVGIALVLYFCRDLLCLQVHAESRLLYPVANSMRIYRDTGSSYSPTQSSFTLNEYGNVQWYGVNSSLQPNFIWTLATLDFDISRLTKKGYYNFDFLVLTGYQGTLQEGYTFAIYTNGGYNVCTSNDSNVANNDEGHTSQPKSVLSVSCETIYIDIEQSTTFKVYAYMGDAVRVNERFAFTLINSNYLTENATEQLVESATETNDLIKDDSIDNNKTSGDLETMSGKTASNGTITQLITLPITLFQSVLNSVGGSCSSMSLGTLFNHELTFPCLDLSSVLGSTLFNIIDILLCGSFILVIRKKFVDIFNHITSLKDRGNEVE